MKKMGIDCFELTGLSIIKAVSALPQDITHLDMSGFHLGLLRPVFKNEDELIELFKTIPHTIKILNLRNNDLGNLKEDLLIKIFKFLPKLGMDSLDLSHNQLGRLDSSLLSVFDALPPIKTLNLCNNELGKCKNATFMLRLPRSIEDLDLSCNELYHYNDTIELHDLIIFSPKARVLNLSDNRLNTFPSILLADVFRGLPSSLQTLILDDNELEYQENEDLTCIISVFNTTLAVTINDRPIQSYLIKQNTDVKSSDLHPKQDSVIQSYEQQKQVEWNFASEQLKDAEDGRYIHYSSILDKSSNTLKPRPTRPDLFKRCPKTTSTFIKINAVIYRIMPKDENIFAVPGRAELKRKFHIQMPEVKLLENSEGRRFVAKKDDEENDEYQILYDLNRTVGCVSKKNKLQKYLVMPYLGQTLSKKTFLTKEQRLRIATDVCLELACLHEGRLSRTNTSYAHYDLKPDNITIDDNDKVHLIDFGNAQKYSKLIHASSSGTSLYRPSCDIEDAIEMTGEQYDVFALHYILFMPEAVATAYNSKESSLLTQDILNEFNLESIKEVNLNISARMLAAILIQARYGLSIHDKPLRENPQRCQMITETYTTYQNTSHLEQKLAQVALGGSLETLSTSNSSNSSARFFSNNDGVINFEQQQSNSSGNNSVAQVLPQQTPGSL